jgi:hypothetical protein
MAEEFKEHYSVSGISRLETPEGTVHQVRIKLLMSRDFQIWRLLQLGYTQEEAGKIFGLTQQGVGKITTDLKNQISGIQKQFAKGKAASEIAEFEGIDELTAWAMILDGEKDDLKRFAAFGTSEYQDDSPRV